MRFCALKRHYMKLNTWISSTSLNPKICQQCLLQWFGFDIWCFSRTEVTYVMF